MVRDRVDIQAKLDEEEDNLSVGERISGLDAAISLYEQALAVSAYHADATYNLADATLEKLECGGYEGRESDTLLRCLDALDSVIARDTSRRAETSGLAHRSVGNVIRSYFDDIVIAKRISPNDLIRLGKAHFDEAVRILSASQDLDTYLLDFGRYLLFCLENLLESTTCSSAEKLHTGRDLVLNATSVLASCLQTPCQSGIDLDVYMEAAEVSLALLNFILTCPELETALPEFTFCVDNLIGYENAINSLNSCEDDAISTVKEIYEALAKFFSAVNDAKNCLKYCSSLVTHCTKHNLVSNEDRGDCLFCIGMVLVKNTGMALCLTGVSSGEKLPSEAEHAMAVAVLAYAQNCSHAAIIQGESAGTLTLSSSSGVSGAFLHAASLHYEACTHTIGIALASSPCGSAASQQLLDDLAAFYFNLLCIGWNVRDERYCDKMLNNYVEVIRLKNPMVADPHVLSARLRGDVAKDPDLRGVVHSEWFDKYIQILGDISSVPPP